MDRFAQAYTICVYSLRPKTVTGHGLKVMVWKVMGWVTE